MPPRPASADSLEKQIYKLRVQNDLLDKLNSKLTRDLQVQEGNLARESMRSEEEIAKSNDHVCHIRRLHSKLTLKKNSNTKQKLLVSVMEKKKEMDFKVIKRLMGTNKACTTGITTLLVEKQKLTVDRDQLRLLIADARAQAQTQLMKNQQNAVQIVSLTANVQVLKERLARHHDNKN
jgi:hypothetical protein